MIEKIFHSFMKNGIKINSIAAYSMARHSESLDQYIVYNLRSDKESYYVCWLSTENHIDLVLNDSFVSKIKSELLNIPINLGKYQHYKSKNYYDLIGITHLISSSLNISLFALYRALYEHKDYGKQALWLRPKEMFFENVNYNGNLIPRFNYIASK